MAKLTGLLKSVFTSKPFYIVGGAVVAAVALGLAVRFWPGTAAEGTDKATYQVRRGELRIAVHQTGDMQAKDSIKIQPEVEGQATIIELVDEGTRVKKDDVIAKLDATELEKQVLDREIDLENAKSNQLRAEEQKKIQELSNDTNIARAILALDAARMDFDKYGAAKLTAEGFLDTDSYLRSGEYRLFGSHGIPDRILGSDSCLVVGPLTRGDAYQQFRDAELEISRARTDLERVETDFKGMDILVTKGFVTKNEYIAKDLEVEEAGRRLESTQLKHYMLKKFTYPKGLQEKQTGLKQAKDQLEQARLQANSEMTQRNSAIKEAKSVYEMKEKNLKKMRDRLEKMVVKAPEEGIVLYGDDADWWSRQQVKVGGQVWRGMTLITLPRVTNMIAATKVMERDINKVKAEQKAVVTIPALPGVSLNGKVSKVSSVSSQGRRWWMPSDIKTFDVEITLEGSDPLMKPGMSCEVEILINTLADVLYVPVNAVYKDSGKDVCYVVSKSKVSPVEVKIGDGSDLYVEIKEGLTEGQNVLLYSAAGPGQAQEGESGSQKKAKGAAEAAEKKQAAEGGPDKKAAGTDADAGKAKDNAKPADKPAAKAPAEGESKRAGGAVPVRAGQ